MNQPKGDARPSEDKDRKTAIIINTNARSASPQIAQQLQKYLPKEDLYLTSSLADGEAATDDILRKRYSRVFLGGGDGTFTTMLSLLEKRRQGQPMPELGVLRLGTGNAISYTLGASNYLEDIVRIVNYDRLSHRDLYLVALENGQVTPFVGMGYEADVITDYAELREQASGWLGKAVAQNVGGYLLSMLSRSVPRTLSQQTPVVRIVSRRESIQMTHDDFGDHPRTIPAGTVLYEGPGPAVSVGAIPYFGFQFRMFPFVSSYPGYLQLRIICSPITTILRNLYPKIWKGTFRHPGIMDWLVKDVQIESDVPMNTQVGGDAFEKRDAWDISITEDPVNVIAFD